MWRTDVPECCASVPKGHPVRYELEAIAYTGCTLLLAAQPLEDCVLHPIVDLLPDICPTLVRLPTPTPSRVYRCS